MTGRISWSSSRSGTNGENLVYGPLSLCAMVRRVMISAHSLLPGSSMVWKAFWDMLRGDGILPPSFTAKSTQSDFDRLFFIEGVSTTPVALIAVFILPDFPSTSRRWLSPIETRSARRRIEEGASFGDEALKIQPKSRVKLQGRIFHDALADWRVVYITEVRHSSNSQSAFNLPAA